MILLLALLPLAFAGRLDDGWRGTPYGPAENMAQPPNPDCVANPEPSVGWRCPERVGDAAVSVSYLVDEGRYFGVIVECQGYADCAILREAVHAAWSVPFTPKHDRDTSVLPDGFWQLSAVSRDGVSAVWAYNRYSGKGSASVFHTGLVKQVEAARKARAARAGAGL